MKADPKDFYMFQAHFCHEQKEEICLFTWYRSRTAPKCRTFLGSRCLSLCIGQVHLNQTRHLIGMWCRHCHSDRNDFFLEAHFWSALCALAHLLCRRDGILERVFLIVDLILPCDHQMPHFVHSSFPALS